MRLEYVRPRRGVGNFGDDLNEWLWDEIAPGLVDRDGSSLLLGIGTIFCGWFTERLPVDCYKVVLGSGGGKAGGPPVLDHSWCVYGVRGPLTAAYSGLSEGSVLTDPAMLVSGLSEYTHSGPRKGIGFMPHIWSANQWDWRSTCNELDLIYIDPFADARSTLRIISGLERLVTEAMHGAIVADAFRTPWVAVSISRHFEPSKWCDWGASLGLPIYFHNIPDLYDRQESSLGSLKTGIKDTVRRTIRRPIEHRRHRTAGWQARESMGILRNIAAMDNAQLSASERLEQALGRTRNAIQTLLDDKRSGRFDTAPSVK